MSRINKIVLVFLVGILLLHLLLLLKFKFTAWPEMLVWPYLTLHGLLPYKDIAIAHTPLLLVFLTVFYKLFGVGISQLQIFTWGLILAFDAFFFWVVRRLWGRRVALIALTSFVIWQLFFDGNGLWFDLFMGFWMFASFYFLRIKKWFAAGVLFALAVFTKQTAAYFIVPVALEIFGSKAIFKDGKNFVLGGLVVLTSFVFLLFAIHLLPSFYYWAVNFGVFILPKASGQIQLPDLRSLAVAAVPFAIFIPLFFKSHSSARVRPLQMTIWAFVGCLGAYPRFEYFHFQPAVPYLAIVSGLVFTNLNWKNVLIRFLIIFYVFASLYLLAVFFIRNYDEGIRFYEQDVQDVASYVRQNSIPGEKIFVMNYWDSLYALTDTLPATDPWVPQLSWYQEIHGVQEKEVADLENSKPRLILLQQYSETGLSSYIPEKVYAFVSANYKISNKVDGIEILVPK